MLIQPLVLFIYYLCLCCFLIQNDLLLQSSGPVKKTRYLPLTVVLWVGPGPVLLVRHWPVASRVAGATDVLHLPFLLHGLTDAGDITCKLRIGANCVWKREDKHDCEFLTPSAFLFRSLELNPFSQTVDHSRKITIAVSQLCTIGLDCDQKSLLHCKNSN